MSKLQQKSQAIDNSTSFEKVQKIIAGMNFDETIQFLQEKVRIKNELDEKERIEKSKLKIDTKILNRLAAAQKENKWLRSQNVELTEKSSKAKKLLEELLDHSQKNENQIAEMREKLLLLSRRRLEIEYILQKNQMTQFVEENMRNLEFEKVYAEIPHTSEIQLNEYEGKLEVIGEKGELIFEEVAGKNMQTEYSGSIRGRQDSINRLGRKESMNTYNDMRSYQNPSETKLVTPIRMDLFNSIGNETGSLEKKNTLQNFDTFDQKDTPGDLGISDFLRPRESSEDLYKKKRSLFAAMKNIKEADLAAEYESKQTDSATGSGVPKRDLFGEMMKGYSKSKFDDSD